MKYQSFKNQSMRSRTNLSREKKEKNKSIGRSVITIIVLALGLFGLKLLFTPVVRTLANVWEESTTAISFILPGAPKIEKDEYGRTNTLLIGLDKRSFEPYEYIGPEGSSVKNGFRADTIIVVSTDTETNEVDMISLPRDLWVKVPGFDQLFEQHTKINAVHALGDQFDYPQNQGIGLLKEVVENVLGIPLHYWARVDFEAFVEGVNAVGGIDIYVERAFDDYQYPRAGYEDALWESRFEYVHFDQGWQHMDGEKALKYARSRHALGPEGSDFARAQRQQNVISAVAKKTINSETLFNLEKVRALYQTLSNNVTTNIELGELPLFYKIFKSIENFQIQNHVLGSNELSLLYTPDAGLFGGAYVLIPTAGQNNYTQIQEWVHSEVYAASDN